MDLRELKEILQILEEKEITEFELEEEGMKLRIRKAAASSNHAAAPTAVAALIPMPAIGRQSVLPVPVDAAPDTTCRRSSSVDPPKAPAPAE